nr:gas vesicle protein GvpD [Haladaptatus sp. R4]
MTLSPPKRISTGVDGLDEILHGGIIPGRSYLVRGDPGTGKTILGINYLTTNPDDTVMFVNLEESEHDIRENAATLGIDIGAVNFLDLSPDSDVFVDDQSYDIFSPSEVEQEPLTQAITDRVEAIEPDGCSSTRSRNFVTSRPASISSEKQVIAFMRYLKEQGATILLTSENTENSRRLPPVHDRRHHRTQALGARSNHQRAEVPRFLDSGRKTFDANR